MEGGTSMNDASEASKVSMREILADVMREPRDQQSAVPPNPLERVKPWWVEETAIPRREFVYGGHYLRKAITCTAAPGGRAKTTWSLIEAVGMAVGYDLMTGAKLDDGPRRVGVLNAEEPQEELDRRVAAICKHYNIKRKELGDRLFVCSVLGLDPPLILARFNGKHIERNDLVIGWLLAFIVNRALDVWVLDPFSSFHHCRENLSDDMDPLIKLVLGKLAGETNSAGEIVHHTTKPRAGFDSTVDDTRGSSAIVNACRMARVLNFMNKEEAKRFGIPDERRVLHVKVETGKSNPAAVGNRKWFCLEVVPLANGDEVVCSTLFAPRVAKYGLTTEELQGVRKVGQGGAHRADPQAEDWFGWHLAKALGIDAARGHPNERDDLDRLKKMIKAALDAGIIKIEDRLDERRRSKPYIVASAIPADDTLMTADDIDAFTGTTYGRH
jgi:hypothetical protein